MLHRLYLLFNARHIRYDGGYLRRYGRYAGGGRDLRYRNDTTWTNHRDLDDSCGDRAVLSFEVMFGPNPLVVPIDYP